MKANIVFRSITANKYSDPHGNVVINNNSTISSVEGRGSKLSVGFVFKSAYEPNVGEIRLEGLVTISDTEEKVTGALNFWEESGKKNLPEDLAESIHNYIIMNCMTETVVISREVHLPSPIPAPRVAVKKKEEGDTESYIR